MPDDHSQQVAVAIATIQTILDRLEARAQNWESTRYKVQQVEDDLKALREAVDRIVRTLHYGNGVDPVLQRLSFAESSIKDMRDLCKALEETSKARKKEQATVWVALIGSFGLIAKELVVALTS